MQAHGYIIQDNDGHAIFGFGHTIDQAWSMVVEGVGNFFDAYGDDMPADKAFENQFKAYRATAALIAQVKAYGGAISWTVIDGVACTNKESERA